jgi:DNA-directed RNA polymerase subunit RPC12/RpoP
MARIKLRIATEGAQGTTVDTGKPEPAIDMKGSNEYVCASCDQVLVIANPGQITDMIVVCGNCRTRNLAT